MPVYVLFVSGTSGIFFIPSAGAITDHNQSLNDIDPNFNSQLHVENPGQQKPVYILPSKLGERAYDRN